MNIAYLQCDMRYNNRLLEKMGGLNKERYVVEHTIDRVKEMGCTKILAGIYQCEENNLLIRILENQGVQVVLSEIDNVSIRFLNSIENENVEYIIRVGGDQVLCDAQFVNRVLEKMKEGNYDWFYETESACVLPDIVRKDILIKYKKDIEKEKRYFYALEGKVIDTRYKLEYPCILPFDFRADSNEGFRICNLIIENDLDLYEISKKCMLRMLEKTNNYLVRTGLMGSWLFPEEYFIDEDRKINPWWCKTIIDFIIPRLNRDMKVFEWGAGNSTFFWSYYVGRVTSVEYDYEWYVKVGKELPENVTLKYCELEYGGKYCSSVLEEKEEFDIILIDGRDRVRCSYNAIRKLSKNGIILWDDTERTYYQEGYDFLEAQGFKRLELRGVKYGISAGESFTSIFYRNDNVLNI